MSSLSLSETIKKIHSIIKPKRYLEISDDALGCRFVDLADPQTNVIGVNFWPMQSDLKHLPENITIFPVSSDYFFHSPYMTDCNKYRADLVLIDGCKKVEMAMKNAIFANNLLEENGFVMITNTSPELAEDARRAKFGDNYSSKYGDVYRFLNILKRVNVTDNIHQILCDDGGLTIIGKHHSEEFRLQMIYLVRDVLNVPLDEREKSYDITPEEYFNPNSKKNKKKKDKQEVSDKS